MTQTRLGNYRIVYVDDYGDGLGHYCIQQPKRFLFWKYWKGTHLLNTHAAAVALVEWLSRQPKYGDVLNVFDTDGRNDQ